MLGRGLQGEMEGNLRKRESWCFLFGLKSPLWLGGGPGAGPASTSISQTALEILCSPDLTLGGRRGRVPCRAGLQKTATGGLMDGAGVEEVPTWRRLHIWGICDNIPVHLASAPVSLKRWALELDTGSKPRTITIEYETCHKGLW